MTALLHTPRLVLRQWRPSDVDVFVSMNADARVMEFFQSTLSEDQSRAQAEQIQQFLTERRYGLFAVEVSGVADFIGYVGLAMPRFEAHFTPCTEIGWRLAFEHWDRGYATEAALVVRDFAIDQLELPSIVSFTSEGNRRSRRVMERIGMSCDPNDDFDHPSLPIDHALRRHVLYRYPPRTEANQP